MIGKLNQAKMGQTLQGIRAQTSTYGSTIPRIYGTTVTSPLITWLNGLRQASSGKKSGKKGGPPTYRACVSMLLGHNPIQQVFRVWGNQTNLGVNRVKLTSVSGPSRTIVDSDFHTVFAVTANVSYSVAFNDYGSNGPTSFSGVYELPLWNLAMQGPDPTNGSGYRWAPFTYYCLPGSNVVSQLYGGFTYNIYYAQFHTTGWGAHTAPLQQVLNSAFESSLGDGTEYTGYKDFTAERIIYPWFAGVGSYNFDLGLGGAPQMRMVCLASYGVYPDVQDATTCAADADFADMVEDVFKMGQTQAAMLSTGVGTATQVSPIQPGVSCFEYPGAVQKKFWAQAVQGNFSGSMQYDVPVTKGDVLVVAVGSSGGSPITLSSVPANTWTPVVGVNGKEFFYAVAGASGTLVLTIGGAPTTADVQIFQIAGGDTVDSVTVATASGSSLPKGTVTTTNTAGQPAYILAWVLPDTAGSVGSGVYPLWKPLIPAAGQGGNYYAKGPANSYTQHRIVNAPGTYAFTGDVATSTWIVVLLAVKNAVAPAYPKPVGNILDQPSLDLCRAQCRANGLWGSMNMDHQQKAQAWLEDLYMAMNSAPVWSGFTLKSIPRSEVSFAGNGAIYTAPTASGPVATFAEGDFIASKKGDLITIDRKAVVDRPDLLRMQHPDRGNSYNNTTVPQPDPGGLTLYGLRYASPKVMAMVQRVNVARMLLGIMVRRQNYLVNNYKFTVKANKGLLIEAMDLVLITDSKLGINALPVRLTSVEEDKFGLKCEAEDFVYGLHDPLPLPVTENAASNPGMGSTPAAVNTPIFIEPPGTLTGTALDELWIAVSDVDPTYGGCFVYASVDGGSTYGTAPIGKIAGNAVTGHTTGNWAQAVDPDTTNNLPVDLSESLGALQQYSVQQEDQFLYPCYVAGGGGIFPFELITYAVANPTGTYTFTLMATGGNKLRRGVFGTWASSVLPNTGPAHANNSRFAFFDPTGTGLLKITVPSAWTGKTIFFKFTQFNQFGGGLEQLSNAVAYSYTILGTGNTSGPGGGTGGSGGGGNVSYTINPTNPLSQTSPTNIRMAAVTATFSPSNLQTHYNLRNFTIPLPGGPVTYYVTVFDPTLTGDTGAGTTLTAFCQTTQAAAHVGQPGYIYMGQITVQPSGTAAGGSGGGTNPSGNILLFIPIPSTARGNFSMAHGLSAAPTDVDIKNQSDGTIRFQPTVMWDATNVYLNASDDGLVGTLVITI